MNILEQRQQFEANKRIYESAKLVFRGVGRMEKRQSGRDLGCALFEESGRTSGQPRMMIYQLEDPYISVINKQLVLGGTHVRNKQGRLDTFCGYFYKGRDLHDLYYFTTGPDYMKDIRLVELRDGRIGVFSRPRGEEVRKQFGSESLVGFTVIDSLDALSPEVIKNAPYISGLFRKDEWGGRRPTCSRAGKSASSAISAMHREIRRLT